ncbi:DUF6130 family protein [Paenibacillus eucommiae]|uniref:DUF4399 domain-containing protein n=1 Tax=Paenibacillus eucommiae TaxID=1355755 RepID=A0ABS4JCY0_9BACL|nr:DUF6130 family protein [Paenibacillus eucommiae]MBP1997096.1 hypothetical protein [Paenibacillus eucommiae]
MKKTWIIGIASLMVLGSITTACSTKEDPMLDHSSMIMTGSGQGDYLTDGAVSKKDQPTLNAKIVQDGTSATITFQTSNIKLSPDHMGKKNVPGEGHLHLTVNGKQKAMLDTTAPIKLENLSVGKHVITLDLQQNDHTPLHVERVFKIEVK